MVVLQTISSLNEHLDSNDESDEDYIPSAESSSDGEQIETSCAEEQSTGFTAEAQAKAWQAFVDLPATQESDTRKETTGTVLVKRLREFAGTLIEQEVEVDVKSSEGQKWLKENPDSVLNSSESKSEIAQISDQADSSKYTAGHDKPTNLNSSEDKKPIRAPIRKRKAGLLQSLAAGPPKKLSVLDKSKMDWHNHTKLDRYSLDQNAKNGGQLAKTDFLKRVQDRCDEEYMRSK